MSTIEVYNLQKKKVGDVNLPEGFLLGKAHLPLVHQVLNWQRSHLRAGTSSVKNRHAVSGSTLKIYRQKGTGNARHGDIKAPIFVGGGQTFGPRPSDWSTKLPKKMRHTALRSLIGQKYNEKRLYIFKEIDFKAIKTKIAVEVFEKLNIGNALVVLDKPAEKVFKSLRNVPGFKVILVNHINVLDVLAHDYLVMTQVALDKAQEILA